MRRWIANRAVTLGLGLGLLAAVLVMVNVIAARHGVRADWTPGRVWQLSPKTVRLLAGLRTPATVTLLMAPPDRFTDSVYHDLRELLRRVERHGPVEVRSIDVDAEPERAALVAKHHEIPERELREGALAVTMGDRHSWIPARDVAEYRVTPRGARLAAFKGEAALLTALLELEQKKKQRVCFLQGHGEAPIDSYADDGYGTIADEIRRDGFAVRPVSDRQLASESGVLTGCRVVVIGGPSRALAGAELQLLDRYLVGGGRLLVLLGPVLDRTARRYLSVGIERWLRRWGAGLRRNIVIDYLAIPGEQPLLSWGTRDGYGDHPIGRALAGRLTIWRLVREVRPLPDARPGLEATTLVHSSGKGWGETDLDSLRVVRPRFDAAVDSKGPVPVAVATSWRSARVVVLGSERIVLDRWLASDVVRDYNRDLVLGALGWLAGRSELVSIGPKRPQSTRLILDGAQLSRIFLLVVVGLPMISACLGLWVWWRRRR